MIVEVEGLGWVVISEQPGPSPCAHKLEDDARCGGSTTTAVGHWYFYIRKIIFDTWCWYFDIWQVFVVGYRVFQGSTCGLKWEGVRDGEGNKAEGSVRVFGQGLIWLFPRQRGSALSLGSCWLHFEFDLHSWWRRSMEGLRWRIKKAIGG